jgi:hypothetical protein
MSMLTAEVPRKPGTPGASKNVLLIGQCKSLNTYLRMYIRMLYLNTWVRVVAQFQETYY